MTPDTEFPVTLIPAAIGAGSLYWNTPKTVSMFRRPMCGITR